MLLPLRFVYSSAASKYVGVTSAGTGAGTFKVAAVAVEAGYDGENCLLAGLKAVPDEALPCSNEYSKCSPVFLESGIASGAIHVRSVENAVLFLTFVAISSTVMEDVTNFGKLGGRGRAKSPADGAAVGADATGVGADTPGVSGDADAPGVDSDPPPPMVAANVTVLMGKFSSVLV